jgi:two-component system, NarL family, response regulator LiaR
MLRQERDVMDVVDDDTDGLVPLRAIVADDDAALRRQIRDALQPGNVTVIAEANSGREAIELALFYRPDVLLMKSALPEVDGVEATRRIRAHDPEVRVILLSDDAEDFELGLDALRAGAMGFLPRRIALDTLPRVLQGAMEGEAAISRRLAMALVESHRRPPAIGAGLRPVRSELTDREWEVLDMLASGARTDEIAQALVLSPETVRSHMKNLYRKLGVRSREQAIDAARRLREPGNVTTV